MPSISIQDHLNHADEMVRLAAHAKRLMRLQQLFQTALPPELRPHARIANLRLGKLVIHTTNSAVAAKVRQLTPRFKDLLTQEGVKLTEIEVKAQALPTSPQAEKVEKPDPPSKERKHALTNLTHTLPTDSPIREALEHLLGSMKPD